MARKCSEEPKPSTAASCDGASNEPTNDGLIKLNHLIIERHHRVVFGYLRISYTNYIYIYISLLFLFGFTGFSILFPLGVMRNNLLVAIVTEENRVLICSRNWLEYSIS